MEEINNGKLLGIIFDNRLTMNDHIKHLCKRAGKKVYALARITQVGVKGRLSGKFVTQLKKAHVLQF